jgi:hypothetical protein
MSPANGDSNEMFRLLPHRRRLELDEGTAAAIVAGEVGTDDAPPSYAPVTRLVDAATGPVQAREFEGEELVVAMFAAEHRRLRARPVLDDQTHPLPRLLNAKVAAAVLVAMLALGSGVATAATTGHLPDPVQRAAHDALAELGVSIPGTPVKTADPGQGQNTTTTAQDPATSGQDKGRTVCSQASENTCRSDQNKAAQTTAAGNSETPRATSPSSPTTGPPNGHLTGPPNPTPSSSAPAGPPSSTPNPSGR